MSEAFVGGFNDAADVLGQFAAEPNALDGAEIHLAWYGFGSYDGEACIIYTQGGKLYEVNGSHCSCDGLEGQWSPEETTWEALAHIFRNGTKFGSDYSSDEDKARARLRELVDLHVPAPTPGREEE